MHGLPHTIAGVLLGVAGVAQAADPAFIILPPLGDTQSAYVTGITQTGDKVAGVYWNGSASRGFQYHVGTGVLEPLFGNPERPGPTDVSAMSSDGSFLSGSCRSPDGTAYGAARIRPGEPPDFIGTMPGDMESRTNSISGDGRVLVGVSVRDFTTIESEPFRWTPEEGRQSLGSLFGVRRGDALDVSRDGSTIVGYSSNAALYDKPFVWTAAEGMRALPTLTGGFTESSLATTVSADGSVIFGLGDYNDSRGTVLVRWVGGAIEELSRPLNTRSIRPLATSDSGSLTVGMVQALAPNGIRGFVWTEATGTMFAEEYLSLHGVSVPGETRIGSILSISGDGLTFGGILHDGRGFVAVVPAVPSSVFVLAGLFSAGMRRKRRPA